MRSSAHRAIILASLALSAFCFWKAIPAPLGTPAATAGSADVATLESGAFEPQLVTVPIEDLRPGMRVVGRNPVDEDADRDLPEPDPETWRLVRVRIEHKPGQYCDAQLLRPLSWIEETGAAPGATIWLDIPEMFIEGEAEVLDLEACPEITSGTAAVVTGTFLHRADQLVELHFADVASPVVCTRDHPFWSDTRREFVPAEQLTITDFVRTAPGRLTHVTSVNPHAGGQAVYGIEVYREHVYHVGSRGVLVHNASSKGTLPEFLRRRFEAGEAFNKENRPRYTYNEVEVVVGGRKYRVDSYEPGKEIVSRRLTQFSFIRDSTAIGYFNEFTRKYADGAIISDSVFNRTILRGTRLRGDLIFEVPEQKRPISQVVLDAATARGITIRDVKGRTYN